MQKIYIQPRRAGKTSRTRAAVRVLRKAGYIWANGSWQAPFITLTVRECDIDRIKAEWQNAIAKAPCTGMRLQPYQKEYMRKATGMHQIAEPSTPNSNTCEMLEALKAVAEKLGSRPYGTGSYLPKSIRDKVMAAIANTTK